MWARQHPRAPGDIFLCLNSFGRALSEIESPRTPLINWNVMPLSAVFRVMASRRSVRSGSPTTKTCWNYINVRVSRDDAACGGDIENVRVNLPREYDCQCRWEGHAPWQTYQSHASSGARRRGRCWGEAKRWQWWRRGHRQPVPETVEESCERIDGQAKSKSVLSSPWNG